MRVLVLVLILIIPKITYTQVNDFKDNAIDSLYESENRRAMELSLIHI